MTTPAKAEREGLRACPFCGGAAEYWRNGERVTNVACCADKGCIGNEVDGDAEQWNRRSDPVRDALVVALEKINTMACYASEEDTESREGVLLMIGDTARAALASAAERKAGRG